MQLSYHFSLVKPSLTQIDTLYVIYTIIRIITKLPLLLKLISYSSPMWTFPAILSILKKVSDRRLPFYLLDILQDFKMQKLYHLIKYSEIIEYSQNGTCCLSQIDTVVPNCYNAGNIKSYLMGVNFASLCIVDVNW